MGEEEKARQELTELKAEHQKLDSKITALMAENGTFDQLLLQRLKKRKLWLKDRIATLQEFLCDDIIA